MKKRVFIIHGWDFNPNMNWYPWLKKELENREFEVFVPEMPDTSEPKISSWVSHLSNVVKKADKNTYFIGHSIGCQTIMRYLESQPSNVKIGGLLFVAGWIKLDHLENKEVEEIAKPWLETHIDFSKVKEKTDNISIFLSSNDPYNCFKENKKLFAFNLKAKLIILNDMGHFTQDDGIKKLRPALDEFLKISR